MIAALTDLNQTSILLNFKLLGERKVRKMIILKK